MFYRRLALWLTVLSADPGCSEGFQRSFLVLPRLLRCGIRVGLEVDKAMNLGLAVIQRHESKFEYKRERRRRGYSPQSFRLCHETLSDHVESRRKD